MDRDERELVEKLIREISRLARQVERIANKYAPEPTHLPGCIVAGQIVATPDGAVPVEQLREGATVLSLSGNKRRKGVRLA